jgi:hypothetical protein
MLLLLLLFVLQLLVCEDCRCALYCSDSCMQLGAEGHSLLCNKLQAAKNVSNDRAVMQAAV